MRSLTLDEARARLATSAWVDVRDEAAFVRAHLPGSANLPLERWDERRHEWPPPEVDVVVVADQPAAAREAAERLGERRGGTVAWLDASWEALGPDRAAGAGERLWRAAPFLEQAIAGLARGRALDVACGGGRDAVFLALEGFDVEAWDHDTLALEQTRDLARRHGVTVTTVAAELEAPGEPAPGVPEWPEAAFALVVCMRYLHRPLFPRLARALAPGGTLVYETYRDGQERFGRPRRARFLLRSGELREAFPGLEVVSYEEPAPAGGPWTARLVARAPGGVRPTPGIASPRSASDRG